ncbi:MAG: alpha/beta hydrolase [Alphaproteobacteria bacterium]|nr:MAG: alpha/beta hydrolase [Alphaproteobacteria bacterium]
MPDKLDWPAGFRLLSAIPPDVNETTPVLVAVHGISRNAQEIRDTFRDAARGRLVILAPEFDRQVFSSYQRLGLASRGLRADLMLEAALERFARATGIATSRFHLFGYSGGAQFAHRFAMMYPGALRSLHLAAAGWYTFADPRAPWPRGIGRSLEGRRVARTIGRALKLPITVYVGGGDRQRDPALRQDERIDRQQGRDRVERARNWVRHVSALRPAGSEPVELRILGRAGHSFLECCAPEAGNLAQMVVDGVLDSDGAATSGRLRRARRLALRDMPSQRKPAPQARTQPQPG